MNDLDLAVLTRASSHGQHSVSMLLDANDVITVTVYSPTPTTTMKSIIRIGSNAAECSFSFSEKELKHGGKVELTAHVIHCETMTDVNQILDKFRHHLRASYIDPDAIKMHLVDKKDKFAVTSGKITNLGSAAIGDIHVQVVGRSKSPDTNSVSTPAEELKQQKAPSALDRLTATVKRSSDNFSTKDDLPFNTDLDEEDKP